MKTSELELLQRQHEHALKLIRTCKEQNTILAEENDKLRTELQGFYEAQITPWPYNKSTSPNKASVPRESTKKTDTPPKGETHSFSEEEKRRRADTRDDSNPKIVAVGPPIQHAVPHLR